MDRVLRIELTSESEINRSGSCSGGLDRWGDVGVEPPAGGARVRTEAEIQLNSKVTETRLQSLTNALPRSRTQRRRFLIGCLT